MKRFVLIFTGIAGLISLTGIPGICGDVWISSTNAVTNQRGSLCPGGQGAVLHSVCVVDAVATSTAAVYSSSFTLTGVQNITGVIDTSETGSGCYTFDVIAANGLYLDHFGTSTVTALFQCYARN